VLRQIDVSEPIKDAILPERSNFLDGYNNCIEGPIALMTCNNCADGRGGPVFFKTNNNSTQLSIAFVAKHDDFPMLR